MPKQYKWKGWTNIPVNAQVAGEHLDKLKRRKRKKLHAEDVLEDAKDPDSPIHGAFEWDDDEAAEKYRLGQARDMIRCLVFVTEEETEAEEEKVTRAYVNVVDNTKHHYMEHDDAFAIPALREQLVQRAWRELKTCRRKYEHIAEMKYIWDAMDAAEEAKTAKPKTKRKKSA